MNTQSLLTETEQSFATGKSVEQASLLNGTDIRNKYLLVLL
jgi:hypothetical protein